MSAKKIKALSNSNRGFTLIEIMLVISLLAIVMGLVGRKLFGTVGRGKVGATKIQIKQIEGNLDTYRVDCNFYPTTEQGGLKALIEAPTTGRKCPNYNPAGYNNEKKKLPVDAWGNEYIYTCDDGINYEIKSLGADGVEGGEGDNADISSKDE